MPVVTETAFFKLKPEVNPEERGSEAATKLEGCLRVTVQQKGFLRQYWGVEIEDSSILVWSVDWEDLKDREAYMNSEQFKSQIANLAEIFDFENDKPKIFQTYFTADAPAAREAPVTEVNYFNLPSDFSEEQKAAFEDAILGVAKVATTVGSCSACAIGWVAEKMENDTDPTGEAIAFNVNLGWPTVEEHIKLTKTEEFAKARGPLGSMVKPVKAIKNMRHVKFHGKN